MQEIRMYLFGKIESFSSDLEIFFFDDNDDENWNYKYQGYVNETDFQKKKKYNNLSNKFRR